MIKIVIDRDKPGAEYCVVGIIPIYNPYGN